VRTERARRVLGATEIEINERWIWFSMLSIDMT
jgi:hypothetical protein